MYSVQFLLLSVAFEDAIKDGKGTVGAFKIHTILKDFLLYFRPFDGIVLLLTDRVDNEDLLVGGGETDGQPPVV